MPGEIAGTAKIHGVVLNLSRGGSFFVGARVVPVGSQVEMLIRLPGIEPIRVQGQIRHHTRNPEGEGMGIEFTAVSDSDLRFINEFVNARLGGS